MIDFYIGSGAIALIFLIFQMIVLAIDIDIGAAATDRGATLITWGTRVFKDNPANASGKITSIEIWVNTTLVDVDIATFYVESGDNLSTRDWVNIGNVTAGSKQTFTQSAPYIDMGADAINRGSALTGPYTVVNQENPVKFAGTINSIEIYANVNMTGVKVAVFHVVGGNFLTARDFVTIGTVTSGSKQTFTEDSESNPIALNVEEGDYIGLYYSGGILERDTGTDSSTWYINTDQTEGTNVEFGVLSGQVMSLFATGVATRTSISLDVEIGDYIGIFYKSGILERDLSGGLGMWYIDTADHIPCTNQAFSAVANQIYSIYGSGATEEEEANAIFMGTNF